MNSYSRARIRLNNSKDCIELVSLLNSDGTVDKYVIEDENGIHRADARSFLGVLYMTTDYNNETYLVNLTNDNVYPIGIDKFRPNIICDSNPPIAHN